MSFATTTRNADLTTMLEILRDQQGRKLDVVVPASQIRARDGLIVVRGAEQLLTADGVSTVDGTYRPTVVFDEGISQKLGIQISYLRKLRAERPDILDANINGWLHGKTKVAGGEREVIHEADSRNFMLRLFRGEDGVGVARAMLSDRFGRIENLDILMTILQAMRDSGVETEIVGGDLSDRRMYLRIKAPQVQALAPQLLKNYRSPFSGATGADNPTVFAGFEVSNSEVGDGSFSIVPRLVVEICSNGMKIQKDVLRRVHLGKKLEEGVIRWTEETQAKALELVQLQTRDAVKTFLDVEYMKKTLADMEESAQVKVSDPVATMKTLGKALNFDEETARGVLDHFIKGADATAGGVMHAITSYAQTVTAADKAADLEADAMKAMDLAAAAA